MLHYEVQNVGSDDDLCIFFCYIMKCGMWVECLLILDDFITFCVFYTLLISFLYKVDILYLLDLIGTFVFAISGTLTAAEKKFDLFGAFVIALVTAVGGGTIRDLLIGSHPVGWMKDLNYLYLIGATVPISFFFRKHIVKLRQTMFLFDTIGIGVFTILGFQKTLELALPPFIAIIMGTVSAVFGGVVRDTLCNEVPLIFRKEVYAMVCVMGGSLFFLLDKFSPYHNLNMGVTMFFIIIIRVLAVKGKWSLPQIR